MPRPRNESAGNMSDNEIARALISMMAGSTCSNQKPDTLMQDRTSARSRKPLATHGRTIHWVKPGNAQNEHTLPDWPQKRTLVARLPDAHPHRSRPGLREPAGEKGVEPRLLTCSVARQWR